MNYSIIYIEIYKNGKYSKMKYALCFISNLERHKRLADNIVYVIQSYYFVMEENLAEFIYRAE